ncbi:MAG: hypothetical protein ACJA09_003222 [Alcanivorax sp.]|jgi:hypothetical protein
MNKLGHSNMSASEELAIQTVLNRAAYGFDQRELEMLASCFADDAVMSVRIAGGEMMGPFQGRDGIMQMMNDTLAAQQDQRRHVISNIFCEAAGPDSFDVVSYLTLLSIDDRGLTTIGSGVYRDSVMKTEENGWRLTKRHLELDVIS